MNVETYDTLDTRCRMLGHAVPFRYCRCVADGLPCRLVVDCWSAQFDAAAFVRAHYTDEQIDRIFTPPKPKLTSIVELIERAKRAASQPEG